MSETIREALRKHVQAERPRSPYAGAFEGGEPQDSERVEELLKELGFGEKS